MDVLTGARRIGNRFCRNVLVAGSVRASHASVPRLQLAGKTVVLYNRSEVVGRPLAAMLANDGACPRCAPRG
eukprot:scaffold39632_cov29-Tisochrysis_lutea.AAC.4